jgi:hypothetical protein
VEAGKAHTVSDFSCRPDYMLEIVEEKEQTFVSDVLRKIGRRINSVRGDFEDESRITQRCERHPPNTAAKSLSRCAGCLQREARLASPAGARQRQQADVVPQQ